MEKYIETCFNYCDKNIAFFSSDEQKWVNRIHKLKKKFPDDVRIIREPEENDRCIYCSLPVKWFRIQPPNPSTITEEERQRRRERMTKMRQNN